MTRAPLLAVVATLLAAAPAALAAPRAVPAGTASSALVGDAAGPLAWALSPQVTRVLDAATGETLDVPTPAGCDAVSAAGGGHVAWTCHAPGTLDTYPLLMEVASGRVSLAAGVADHLQEDYEGSCTQPWDALGAQWIRTRCSGYHFSTVDFVNWHDGRRHYVDFSDFAEPEDDRLQIASLDRPSGMQRICDPARLATRGHRDGFGDGYAPRLAATMADGWVGGMIDASYVVQRCGSRRKITICTGCGTSRTQLGGGWVSWTDGRFVRARRLGRRGLGRRLSVALPRGATATRAGALIAIRAPGAAAQATALSIWRLPGGPPLPDVG